jgi:hypothetical protein
MRSKVMQQTVSRRSLIAGMFAGAAVLAVDRYGTYAQDATPGSSPASGGPDMSAYPQLDVTITDSELQVSMTTVPAGWVLLNVTNSSSDENGAGVLGPGEGQTMDDLIAAAATPPADPDGFPPFLYEATILGGPGSMNPGESAQALLNIPAGDWAVFPEGNQPPTFITSAESAESNTTAPEADLKVQLVDFAFGGFSKVNAGPQIWEITNLGDQPHMLTMSKVPDGTTIAQVLNTAMVMGTGTPSPDALTEDQFQNIPDGVLLLSTGQTMYLPLTLDTSTYAVLCFVTDPNTGMPHVMEGMAAVFKAA